MQDFEFTIEKKKLYMLQTRHGKRTALAFVKIAHDMVKQKLMSLDSNHGKLTRFFLDLRQELVTSFFCSSQPVLLFALKCKQGYLIA